MDFTWSKGLEAKSKARKQPPRQESLPSIELNASGRSGGSSPRSPSTLKNSLSETQLSGISPEKPMRLSATQRIRAFTERHDPLGKEPVKNGSFESRRNLSKLQRSLVQEFKDHEDSRFLGAKGKDGFKSYLVTRCGSIMAGWRELDLDKNGRLTYYEFINACRRMGYHGNLKSLWAELDANRNGSISLLEIDRETGRYVGTFKLALLKEYGDMITAWQKGLDVNRTGRIEERELEDCCSRLGLALDPKKLFGILSVGPTSLGMTLADFDPEAHLRLVSGDLQGLAASRGDKEFLHDLAGAEEAAGARSPKGGARKFRQESVARDREALKAEKQREAQLRPGLSTAKAFKQALVVRCGSLYSAWREALDLDGNGRIAFHEFNQALHRLGVSGNVKALWTELNPKGKDHLVFADLDPQTDAHVKEMKAKFAEEYGNLLLGWLKGLDTKSSGMVNEEQFVKACAKVGVSGDTQHLFKTLQPDQHRIFLTVRDFDTRAYLALSRGDFRMISEPESKSGDKPLSEKTFLERQDGGFGHQMQRAWQVAQREEFAKACRLAGPKHADDSVEAFELLCKRNYGSLIGAWRLCLDSDGNGKLTFGEFCTALRKLGFAGSFQALFKKYLKEGQQYITLQELDPAAHELVTSFLDLFGKEFGDIETGWRLGFKKDPHECIDEANLREACQALGYPHDAGKLFKCLQPMPGRQLVTIWDLDPSCTRKRQRGDPAFISAPKNAISEPGKRERFAKSEEGAQAKSAALAAGDSSLEAQLPKLELLRRRLRHRYGSTVAAWRQGLDPGQAGVAAFARFSMVLEECNFQGNRKAVWQELAEKRLQITFGDVDPEALVLLERSRDLLLQRFDSLSQAWKQHFDPEGLGRVGEEEFLAACSSLGLASSRKLFALLQPAPHLRSLVKDDFSGLLLGAAPAARSEIWDGKKGEASPAATPRSPSAPSQPRTPSSRAVSPDRTQGNSTLGSSMLRLQQSELSPSQMLVPKAERQYDLKFPASEVRKTTQKHHEQDVIVNSLPSFKAMLRRKYGSVFSAWNHALDRDHNGLVTLRDFADACRTLGVKATQKIWLEIDVSHKGQISLMDLDLESWEAFSALDGLMREKFASTEEGWREVFDPEQRVCCDQGKFLAGCKRLGLEYDAQKLFKLLQPDSGRTALMYADIWLGGKKGKGGAPASPAKPERASEPAAE